MLGRDIIEKYAFETSAAAWLYAQFVVSKTVSLKKTLVGLTPIRLSDIESEAMTQQAPYLGGLVEFYRSRGRDIWTPTGTNVPDYPGLANYWWQYISLIIEGKVSTQKGMDNFAIAIDKHLATIGKNSEMKCAPKLNPLSSKTFWLQQKGAPKQAIADKPIGYTLPYQEAINVWK